MHLAGLMALNTQKTPSTCQSHHLMTNQNLHWPNIRDIFRKSYIQSTWQWYIFAKISAFDQRCRQFKFWLSSLLLDSTCEFVYFWIAPSIYALNQIEIDWNGGFELSLNYVWIEFIYLLESWMLELMNFYL